MPKLNDIEKPTREENLYKLKFQTERYYYACSKSHGLRKDSLDKTLQLFLFLTPQEGQQPQDINHFIKITYQDIVDYIIEPLLDREDLDVHTTMALKEYLRVLGNPNNDQITMGTTKEEKELLIEFYTRNEDLFRRALEVMRDDKSTSDEEKQDYETMLESMATRKSRRRAFSVNGKGAYKMYEVVAEFTKYLLRNNFNFNQIEGLIKQYTNEHNRCHVSINQTMVYRHEKSYYETDYEGTKFYVTKEWGMGSTSGNFGSFLPNVNGIYPDFQIKELN